MFLHITDMCKTRVVPQKKAVFRLDSPALAALCCSTDTNRSTTGLTVSKFQAALCCQNSTGHQKLLLNLILSLIKEKKKVKGKVKPGLLTQSFAGSYTCRMGSTKISMLSEETQNIMLCLEFLPFFETYCHHEFSPCFGIYSTETSLEIHSLRNEKAYTRKEG